MINLSIVHQTNFKVNLKLGSASGDLIAAKQSLIGNR